MAETLRILQRRYTDDILNRFDMSTCKPCDIRVKDYLIREMIELREINLKYVLTEQQVADVVTKPLGHVKFPGFVADMGMSEISLCFFNSFFFLHNTEWACWNITIMHPYQYT